MAKSEKNPKRRAKKDKTKSEKPSYEVYLDYSEHRTGGAALDPDDRWTSYEDEEVEFTPLAVTKIKPDSTFPETIQVDFQPEVGQDISLVVVRYETGCTFGRIIGVWQIIGAFLDHHHALKVKKLINDYSKDDPDYFDKRKKTF